jgi:hypothetical protein
VDVTCAECETPLAEGVKAFGRWFCDPCYRVILHDLYGAPTAAQAGLPQTTVIDLTELHRQLKERE